MAKILLSDVLNVPERCVGDIKVVFLDEVEEALLVFGTPLLCFWCELHWGGVGSAGVGRVVCCGCRGGRGFVASCLVRVVE